MAVLKCTLRAQQSLLRASGTRRPRTCSHHPSAAARPTGSGLARSPGGPARSGAQRRAPGPAESMRGPSPAAAHQAERALPLRRVTLSHSDPRRSRAWPRWAGTPRRPSLTSLLGSGSAPPTGRAHGQGAARWLQASHCPPAGGGTGKQRDCPGQGPKRAEA